MDFLINFIIKKRFTSLELGGQKMVNKFLLSFISLCCFICLSQKGYSSSMIDDLNMTSPSSFLSKITPDTNKEELSEELEWNAISENKKDEKAKSYIYSFFLNHDSYDLKSFLIKKGLSISSIPSYNDYLLAKDKKEVEEKLQTQIDLLISLLN